MTAVPPEAVTAAAVAIHDADCPDTKCSGSALGHATRLARVALEAAAPHIRAAVPLTLVWRDELGEEIARCPRLHPGTERIAIPLSAQHCDLIPGDDND